MKKWGEEKHTDVDFTPSVQNSPECRGGRKKPKKNPKRAPEAAAEGRGLGVGGGGGSAGGGGEEHEPREGEEARAKFSLQVLKSDVRGRAVRCSARATRVHRRTGRRATWTRSGSLAPLEEHRRL